jgi:hypothetical protein
MKPFFLQLHCGAKSDIDEPFICGTNGQGRFYSHSMGELASGLYDTSHSSSSHHINTGLPEPVG